jgi:hypothetical protein
VTVENGGWNFGLALTNLGGKIGYTNDATRKGLYPGRPGSGCELYAVFNEDNKVMFGLDSTSCWCRRRRTPTGNTTTDRSNHGAYYNSKRCRQLVQQLQRGEPQFKTLHFGPGVEYAYQDQFFLRVGYYYESAQQGDLKYFSTGIGLRYSVMELNFSYLVPSGSGTNRNPLSNTLRFGLSV